MEMYYNWDFILKAREEDQKPTGVIVEDYELIVRVLEGETAIRPVVSVCSSFKGVSEEALAKANLTLVENVFMEYALALVVGQTEQAEAYLDLQQKLKPIAKDYAMRLEAVRKRCVGRSYSWDLHSSTKGAYQAGVELFRLDVTDNVEFVLCVKDKCRRGDGKVVCSASVPVHPSALRSSFPTVVKRFYETVMWPESNPRYLAASELLLDEIDRAEKLGHESLFAMTIPREELAAKLFSNPLEFTDMPRGSWKEVDESTQYSYLVVFQDLMAPQSTPLACRWVGSFEVQDLYNVVVYRAPATSFGLMFVVDSNVQLDAVRAGAQGVGLAAKLSKLAVTQDYHTYPEWSAVTEQLRACFE